MGRADAETAAAATSAKRCSTCAIVLALITVGITGAAVVYVGMQLTEMNSMAGSWQPAVTTLKTYQSHLAAQLTTVQRTDTDLANRLVQLESKLAAIRQELGAGKGGRSGKGVGGDEKPVHKRRGEKDDDSEGKVQGGKEEGNDDGKQGGEESAPDDSGSASKKKGKGRKKRRNKGR